MGDNEKQLRISYIKNNIDDLVYEDRLQILEIFKQHIPESSIKENADGCRINLDTVPDEVISKIEYIIRSKLKVPEESLI